MSQEPAPDGDAVDVPKDPADPAAKPKKPCRCCRVIRWFLLAIAAVYVGGYFPATSKLRIMGDSATMLRLSMSELRFVALLHEAEGTVVFPGDPQKNTCMAFDTGSVFQTVIFKTYYPILWAEASLWGTGVIRGTNMQALVDSLRDDASDS